MTPLFKNEGIEVLILLFLLAAMLGLGFASAFQPDKIPWAKDAIAGGLFILCLGMILKGRKNRKTDMNDSMNWMGGWVMMIILVVTYLMVFC